MNWIEIDVNDPSTWPPSRESSLYTLNWNVDQWFLEEPGNLRECIEDTVESGDGMAEGGYHGIRYLVLPKDGFPVGVKS